jgi:hypothetical protein
MISISWKGSLTAAPVNPQIGWMYYNSLLGKTYIWDGSSWNIVSQDGQDGTSPEGFLITWKGELSSAPVNPQKGWAYYNSAQEKSYIWDGSSWQILAQDGQDGEGAVNPFPQIQFQISVNNIGYGEAYNGNQPISNIPFGNATVGNAVSTSFFYIVNVGNSTLELTGTPIIKLSGNDADCFIIEQPSKASLSAGERTSAKIIFSPTSLGEKTASILIQNNTAGNPNYSFTITGNGIDPTPSWYFSMSINGKSYTEIPYYYDMNPDTYSSYKIDTVDMGNIYLNESVSTSMSIMNYSSVASYALNSTLLLSGDPTIQVSGENANLFVVTQPASTSISAGSSTSASIRFSPDSIGIKTATITILNNSMERPNFTFTIVGNVLPARLWPKAFDGGEGDGQDAITCSLIDSSGNLYFIGYGFELVNDHSGSDWWIKKFDSTGNEITANWNKKISLSTYANRPSSAVIDSSNNIYISDGYYTLKFAPDGTEDMNWHKNVGGTLCIDTQDNIFILSSSTLRYFTSSGNEKWATKTISGFTMNMATTDSTGNVYIVGYGNNLIDTYSQNDAWIKKFDSAGNEITSGWNKILDWGHSDPETATRIFFDGTNIIASGTGTDLINGYSDNDGWFKKFSTAGSELSSFIIQDANSLLLRVDASGNYFVSTNSNTTISKYTATGQRQSQFSLSSGFYYNGNSKYLIISSLLFDDSNNLYVAGYSSNLLTDTSNTDWVIRKFNNMGIEQ